MNTPDITSLLLNQVDPKGPQTDTLVELIDKYPYMQCIRALYLKNLYQGHSKKYNNELKKTAAYTLDRDILFEYITGKAFMQQITFEQNQIETSEPKSDQTQLMPTDQTASSIESELNKDTNHNESQWSPEHQQKDPLIDLPSREETEKIEKASLQEQISQKVEDTKMNLNSQPSALSILPLSKNEQTDDLEQKLEIGSPLQFSQDEKHSYNEWLKLASFTPIERQKTPVKQEKEIILAPEQEKNLTLINKFIETNPKIVPTRKPSQSPVNIEVSLKENSSLMTETLARIYLEQKKYLKAIQAYEILILKYPEKSSYFANQILDIKTLQQHNS